MAEELDGHRLTIVSFANRHLPVGVHQGRSAIQNVFVDAPVHDWTAHKVGGDTYRLSVGGYNFVGAEGGKVVASIHDVHETLWKITHQIAQNAYTIALADKPHFGWTIPVDSAHHGQIVIGPIISTRSLPPQFLPGQLFLFNKD